MHDYAIFNHSRANIGRWLGICSMTISSFFTSVMVAISIWADNPIYAGIGLTSAVIYLVLHWLFDKMLWKFKFFDIPNISGVWAVRGESLREGNNHSNEEDNVRFHWEGELDIAQSWEKISITQETSQSNSESYTATLVKCTKTTGGSILHYSYKNFPKTGEHHELSGHGGYCEIIFDEDSKTATASYFNSNGRRTFGRMYLTKKESK